MPRHRQPGRLAHRSIRRIERYRGSPLGRNNACRFTPSCSHYAEEALRARSLPVALLLIVGRLLRCNPFMHRRVADPVRRSRRWHLRPNALPTFFSIVALSGFIVVTTAGIAQAVGVSNGCTASLNGKAVGTLDSDHPLVVRKHQNVRFVGTVPPSVANAPSDQLASNTNIKVDFVKGFPGVSSSDHPGHGPIWGGLQNVDKYLTWTVGLYHVKGVATGQPGGWTCEGDAYVELKDGSPLKKPVGDAAAAAMFVGLFGAGMSARASAPDPQDEQRLSDDPDAADAEDYATDMVRDGNDFIASLGCLFLIVIAVGAAFLGKDLGAAAIGGTGVARSRPSRVWSHGHPIAGFFSGLLLGLGITVLLQEYAVWPLTIVTAIVFPAVIAVICSLRAWLGRAYKYRTS